MQQESSSARSSSLARDWYHLGRARTLDEVGRLVDALTLREHQRLSGRASAAAISRSSRSARSALEVPVGVSVSTRWPTAWRSSPSATTQAHSTALGFFVNTGARDETDDVAGVSHFLEHMVFKGTPTPLGRRREPRVRRDGRPLQRLHQRGEHGLLRRRAARVPGPRRRAAGRHPPPVAARGRLRHREAGDPRRDPACTRTSRRSGPTTSAGPPTSARTRWAAACWAPPRASRDLPVEAMRDYFRRRYSPGNIVLAGAGPDRLRRPGGRGRALLRRLGAASRRPRRSSRPPRTTAFTCSTRRSATQQYALQLAAGPAADDADRYAAKLLATVLGDDSGSRLYWELVDPGLAEHASLSHCEYQGAGMMMTYMSCEPEQAADNLQRILDVYRRAEADGVTAGRTGAGQEQDPLPHRALQRAAPRPAVRRRQRLGLPPRVSPGRATTWTPWPPSRVDDVAAVLAKYPLTPRHHRDHRPAGRGAAAAVAAVGRRGCRRLLAASASLLGAHCPLANVLGCHWRPASARAGYPRLKAAGHRRAIPREQRPAIMSALAERHAARSRTAP